MTSRHPGPDLPRLVAHRGWPRRYPENTLLSLERALEAGAEFVEFDVQMTADGVPVLLHDADLRRMAGVDLKVTEHALEALRAHEVNERGRLGDAFSGLRLATLEEVVALLARFPRATAFVEIKRASLKRFGIEAVVGRVLLDLEPLPDRCVPISFAAEAMRRSLMKGAPRVGWAIEKYNDAVRLEAEALAPQFLFIDHKVVPPEGSLWPGPWTWVAYTVNAVEPLAALAERGISLVETDWIGEMLAWTAATGVERRGR
jgi:glycerophosphoryl diester phosphodiesterase